MSEPLLMRVGTAPLEGPAGARVLMPMNAQTTTTMSEWQFGSLIELKIVRTRSLPQHRLFFAILDHVAKASKYETADRLLMVLKVHLGYCDLIKLLDGSTMPAPRSISFAKMSADDFQRFFDESVQLICAEVIPGTNGDDLIREVQLMLSPQK